MGSLRNLKLSQSQTETKLEEFLRVFELSGLQEATELLELLEKYMALGTIEELDRLLEMAKEMALMLREYQKLGDPEDIREVYKLVQNLTKKIPQEIPQ
jgi:hypothetical protein